MTYDIESLLFDIKTLMISKLNTKIGDINTEKNDQVVLATVKDDAYFIQSLDGRQANYNPYVYIGVSDIKPGDEDASKWGKSQEELEIAVAIIVADNGDEPNHATITDAIPRRTFRYLRAIKEMFQENFDKNKNGIKLSVQSQVPIELSLSNDSGTERAIGVILRADIG